MDNKEMKFVDMSEEELEEIMGGFGSLSSQYTVPYVRVTCTKCGKTENLIRDLAARRYIRHAKCSCGGDLRYSKVVDN